MRARWRRWRRTMQHRRLMREVAYEVAIAHNQGRVL